MIRKLLSRNRYLRQVISGTAVALLITLIVLSCMLAYAIDADLADPASASKVQASTEASTAVLTMQDNSEILKYLPEHALHPVDVYGYHYYDGPSGREGYYTGSAYFAVKAARARGFSERDYPYHVTKDTKLKMLGPYIICAADFHRYPPCSIVDTSLGKAIVLDTIGSSGLATRDIDILTAWY